MRGPLQPDYHPGSVQCIIKSGDDGFPLLQMNSKVPKMTGREWWEEGQRTVDKTCGLDVGVLRSRRDPEGARELRDRGCVCAKGPWVLRGPPAGAEGGTEGPRGG